IHTISLVCMMWTQAPEQKMATNTKLIPSNQAKGAVSVKPVEIPSKLKRNVYIGPCVRGWNSFNGICYKYFFTKLNWIDAEVNQCYLAYEGHLASIHCRLHNIFIAELIGKGKYFHPHTWLGASDHMKEGLFLWTDGLQMKFTSWMPRKPNNKDGRKNCVVMNHKGTSPSTNILPLTLYKT
uniref:C-type lectin domain-containing protein n=1 Tax=Callorhinchus milii TaxID=7868 RepID=A0A4W3GPG9_CALMI